MAARGFFGKDSSVKGQPFVHLVRIYDKQARIIEFAGNRGLNEKIIKLLLLIPGEIFLLTNGTGIRRRKYIILILEQLCKVFGRIKADFVADLTYSHLAVLKQIHRLF